MMEQFHRSTCNDGALEIEDKDLSGELGDKRDGNRSRAKDSTDGQVDGINVGKVKCDVLTSYSVRRRVFVHFNSYGFNQHQT